MGKGLALQFKKAFPGMFRDYVRACRAGEVAPGRIHVVETRRPHGPKFVMNFPTKRHWRDSSRMEDIEAGLQALVNEVERRGIRSLAVPALGSGLGGLPWPEVRLRIERAFRATEGVRVLVFEPL
jgi:O-acetyl-ADP-ribose deacetylase (regulator of RNase III)